MSDVESITPKSVSLEDQRILAAKIRDVATYQANDMIGNASLAATGEVQRQCDANHLDHRGRRALSEAVCAKLGDRGTDIVPWRSELVSLVYERIIDRLTKAPDGEPALREAVHGIDQARSTATEQAERKVHLSEGEGSRFRYWHRTPEGTPIRLSRNGDTDTWQVWAEGDAKPHSRTELLLGVVRGDDEMEALDAIWTGQLERSTV